MAEVRCVDGSVLSVLPVPVLDREGVPYEATLQLERDGEPFGEVGERCGWFLAATAARLRAAREAGGPDAFPPSGVEAGLRAWLADQGEPETAWPALERYLPRERELFAFLARDPDDVASAGELRLRLRDERRWLPGADGAAERGRWSLRCRAVLEAWGSGGTGVRAVLDSTALLVLLDELAAECAQAGAGAVELDPGRVRRPVG